MGAGPEVEIHGYLFELRSATLYTAADNAARGRIVRNPHKCRIPAQKLSRSARELPALGAVRTGLKSRRPRRLRDDRISYSQAPRRLHRNKSMHGSLGDWPANVARNPPDRSPHLSMPICVITCRPHLSADQGSISLRTKPPIASQLFDHRPTPYVGRGYVG